MLEPSLERDGNFVVSIYAWLIALAMSVRLKLTARQDNFMATPFVHCPCCLVPASWWPGCWARVGQRLYFVVSLLVVGGRGRDVTARAQRGGEANTTQGSGDGAIGDDASEARGG